jgi:WD40 repeat protein
LAGTRAVTGDEAGTLSVWESTTGKKVKEWRGHKKAINGVAYLPSRGLAISISEDQFVRVWNADTGAEITHFGKLAGAGTAVALSPDGRQALFHTTDGTIHVGEVPTTAH